MASGSGKEGRGGEPATKSPEARDRLAFEVDVVRSEDAEAFWEAQRLAEDPASLQRRFHEDRKAALELVIKARNPALVPTLVDVLQDEAITHFYIAEALEQISDEPDRTVAIEIKRSEEAQVDSFPLRAVTSAAEDDKIYQHLQTRELRKAFQINLWRASELIVEDAKSDPIARHIHASNLTPLLRDQGRVQLFMALALARIAEQPQQQSKAIEIAFAEAAQLGGDRETLCFALQSLEPFEDLIVDQLAADASDATWRRRDLTLRFFVVLLGDAALDEQEQLRVAGIVLRCAGGGLDAVIRRMAELSNVTIEEVGLYVCGRVLASSAKSHAAERTYAAGWIQRHLSRDHAATPTSAFVSHSSAAQTSEGSVESPRAPIHPSLTDVPWNMQTSLVTHMDVSQGNSTAAPSPDLDLSSYQITRNGAGDGFSPTRSSTATTAVPDDGVDLATVSFTTSEPFVLRIYTGESPEEERFIQQFRAVASLVESGEVNTEVLADSMAGLIMAYRAMGGAIPDGAGSERVLPGRLPRHIQEHPEKREAASKPVMLSAQETIERFKALRERGEIDAFLQRFVVGKTWNKLQDNKDVAYNLSKHLQNLDLRFSCVNDGTASSLRCFSTTGNKNGSFYFQHYGDGQKHGGSPTIPDLKTVPAPPDQRRGTSKSKRKSLDPEPT